MVWVLPYSGKYCYLSNTEKKSDDVGYNSSEDCLTLNVIRPAGVKTNAELPVVVWIHGYVMSSALCNRMNTKFIYLVVAVLWKVEVLTSAIMSLLSYRTRLPCVNPL
jgi:hypothetical protein